MVKNWADHCSSDEEEEAEPEAVPEQIQEVPPPAAEERVDEDPGPPRERRERVHHYPTEPPYTAYVGNLVYTITEGEALGAAVAALAAELLQTDVKITSARVMKNREDNDRPRGFGYVEVETLEDLQKLMELNTCEGAMIGGRRVHLDTASLGNDGNNKRRSRNNRGGTQVDGNAFRGGSFAKKEQGGAESHEKGGPPAQRPSLNLKPRTKPTDGGAPEGSDSNLGGSSSSIFGSAKARDEQGWQERRKPDKAPTTSSGSKPTQQRDSIGGGGRGGGRGGRNGRGEQGRCAEHSRSEGTKGKPDGGSKKSPDGGSKKVETQPKPAPTVVAAKPADPEKKATTASVANTFAALAFDSDSD